jgi:hypothetical protein
MYIRQIFVSFYSSLDQNTDVAVVYIPVPDVACRLYEFCMTLCANYLVVFISTDNILFCFSGLGYKPVSVPLHCFGRR